jgi:hypothetical protein
MGDRASLSAFSKLIRLDYSLFSALGVLLSGALAGDLSLQFDFLVAFLIVFFSAVGSFARAVRLRMHVTRKFFNAG